MAKRSFDGVWDALKGGRRFTARFLRSMPKVNSGQFEDCYVDTGKHRAWVSRMTVEDGAPYNNEITEETLRAGRWVTTAKYEG